MNKTKVNKLQRLIIKLKTKMTTKGSKEGNDDDGVEGQESSDQIENEMTDKDHSEGEGAGDNTNGHNDDEDKSKTTITPLT